MEFYEYEPDVQGGTDFQWRRKQWRTLPGSDGRYRISDQGDVVRRAREITTKAGIVRKYPRKKIKFRWQNEMKIVHIYIRGKFRFFTVAQLVMYTFSNGSKRWEITDIPYVLFDDNDKENCCRWNLMWDWHEIMYRNEVEIALTQKKVSDRD